MEGCEPPGFGVQLGRSRLTVGCDRDHFRWERNLVRPVGLGYLALLTGTSIRTELTPRVLL